MKTSDFLYELPKCYIAQTPLEPRDSSRLMVLERKTGNVKAHDVFKNLADFLTSFDLLIVNETRVLPARLYGEKAKTGGRVELLLLRQIDKHFWECIVGGKGLITGKIIYLNGGVQAEIVKRLRGSKRLVRFDRPIEQYLNDIGHMPLPPYINEKLPDPERYQTVFSKVVGSAAAPTAGLHFTDELLSRIKDRGVSVSTVTLHVGLDTFLPVKENSPFDHEIHSEWCQINPDTADLINQTKGKGGRVIAVGTTSVRVLETASISNKDSGFWVSGFSGFTDLFILPGYKFKVVDGIITNFHLPRSTLIMLVSAFFGRENVLNAYEIAKQESYRFYSFGDAMLII